MACKLNHTKLKVNYAQDGNFNAVQQGIHAGDCGTLATIMGLVNLSSGSELLKNAFSYNEDGTVTIDLPGLGKNVTVKSSVFLNQKSGFGSYIDTMRATGDSEYVDIENAIIECLSNDEVELAIEHPDWCEQPKKYQAASPIKGIYPQLAMYILTGKEPNPRYIAGRSKEENKKIDEIFSENHENVITIQFPKSMPKTCKDAFGNLISLQSGHAYAKKDISVKSNGEKVITLVNPQPKKGEPKEIVLNYSDLLELRPAIDSIQLSDNDYTSEYFKWS